MSERDEMLALAGELADKLDQLPFGSPNTLLRRVERALRSAATPAPGYAQGFEACREAVTTAIRNAPSLDENGYICEKSALLRVVAALPAPAGVEDWQDISTAPKDGTFVLVFCSGTGAWTPNIARWNGDGWGDEAATFHIPGLNMPTHWMPLPAPPTILAKPAQEGQGS